MNYNNHPKLNYVYVGIDCHKEVHTACVISPFNETLETLTFKNDYKDFEKLIDMVSKYTKDGIQAIYGLEDVKHLGHTLAGYLIERGFIVKHILSSYTAIERAKHPIIDKTDEIDARCIAKVTLDEFLNLPNVKEEELYWTLKQFIKMKTNINRSNAKLKNKLHAQLLHHYPNYSNFFSSIDGKSALDFWENYPSPNMIKDFTPEQLVEDFKSKGGKGGFSIKKATLILNYIKDYNYSKEMEYQENRNQLIITIIRNIKNNNLQKEQLDNDIINLYDKLNVHLHTLIGLTKTTSAEIISEIGDIKRFSNSSKLAKYCGIAPINRSSGGSDKVKRNEFGNRTLNSYIYYLACRSISTGKDMTTPQNAIFLDYYYKKISDGKTKKQALTCVMRRIVNIIYKILNENIPYQHPKNLNTKCLDNVSEKMLKIKDEKKKIIKNC